MFEFQPENNAQPKTQYSDTNINQGLGLLLLLITSIIGSSWLFSVPVYFDIKIVAQIFPLIFSIILLFIVSKIHHTYLDLSAPVLSFLVVFFSWSYVIYLNANANLNAVKDTVDLHHLGMANTMYLLGLCFSVLWLGRYFKYSLYLSLASIITFIVLLMMFTDIKFVYLLALALLLMSSAVFSVLSMSGINVTSKNQNSDRVYESSEHEFLLPAENESFIEQPNEIETSVEPKPVIVVPLNESSITHNWELILRELHGELKNTTDVDQLFMRVLAFLQGAMEFDGAAVGMLQDNSIKKIASYGDDEYLHTQSLNWTGQRIKALSKSREAIISQQPHLSASKDEIDQPVHRLDVPIISNNKILGLMTLFRRELVFDVHDVRLASSVVFHSMISLRLSRLQEENQRLNNESTDVKLTLYSREQFVTKVKPVFDRLSKPRECSLVIVESDNLDTVIEEQGRDVGTQLYKATSKAIMRNLKLGDVFGRYGNEGFMILLDETDLMHAKKIAEKIRSSVAKIKLKHKGSVLTTTVSIGLTIVSDAKEDLPALMRKADMGLFVAKENGRNTVKVSL